MNGDHPAIGSRESVSFPGPVGLVKFSDPAAPSSAPSTWAAGCESAVARERLPANAETGAPRVLVAHGSNRLPALFESRLLASRHDNGHVYRIEPVSAANIKEVEQHCYLQAPRFVVIDIGLVRRAGPAVLRHTRRRMPATDWLLSSDTAAAEQINWPILGQTQGLIDWSVSEHQLASALDAVASGKLWFPRSVLESLFMSLLDADADADAPEHRTVKAKICALGTLSPRETEVFALMRHGMTNRQIAERLGISANTIKKHIANVLEKRGLHARRQALA